jgi:hypothetical protein
MPQPKNKNGFHRRDTEFTWFDRLTMSGGKPRILSLVEGRASALKTVADQP